MRTFTVEVRYTFTGVYTIEAETKDEAIKTAETDCGCVNPEFHVANNPKVTQWDFPVHQEVKAVSIS